MIQGPQFPDVHACTVDGNVFNVIGAVTQSLKRAGHRDEADAFRKAAFDLHSYDEVLVLAASTVVLDLCDERDSWCDNLVDYDE